MEETNTNIKKENSKDIFGKFPSIKERKSSQELKNEMKRGWNK